MGLLPFERIARDKIVRQEVETSDKFGCIPEQRPIKELLEYGIVNLDKPSGPTSHQVSSYVQKILRIKKGGHSGTLDPGVTGILPVALGKGTRVVQSLLIAGKEYVCLMKLHQEKPEAEVKQVLEKFTGKLKQLPPVKSAVKRQWRFRNCDRTRARQQFGADLANGHAGRQRGCFERIPQEQRRIARSRFSFADVRLAKPRGIR